jgi:hypothetical protein
MQIRNRLTGSPELGLKSAIVHRDNVDDYGDLVYEALSKASWIYFIQLLTCVEVAESWEYSSILFRCLLHATQNKTSWVLYNMAAFYWRIKGNAPQVVECTRRALHYSPRYACCLLFLLYFWQRYGITVSLRAFLNSRTRELLLFMCGKFYTCNICKQRHRLERECVCARCVCHCTSRVCVCV